MEERRDGTITQQELLTELRKRGYDTISKRRLIDWRANTLLPSFDLIGSGLGKGRGRECSLWSNGRLVLNQAIWVYELLQLYPSFESLYLPLWMLGYPIPLEFVREALHRPLREMALAIEREAQTPGDLEDIIDDAASRFGHKLARANQELLQMPEEALAAAINILFTPEYDLTDHPFQAGLHALQELDSRLRSKHAIRFDTIQDEERGGTASDSQNDNPLFAHAGFFKRYLSLHELKRAVDDCTNDDLLVVKRDLAVVRELVVPIRKLILILIDDLSAEFRALFKHLLPAVFGTGRLLVLADLSLRHNGFSETIDRSLSELLRLFRDEVNERLEREMEAISENFAATLKALFHQVGGRGSEGHSAH